MHRLSHSKGMKRRASGKGFTIIELIIVVVVIAILSMISAAVYGSAQIQARNTQSADAAHKVADAIRLFIVKNGHFPRGGLGSTTAISGTECADGSNAWFATGRYTCTVEDTLVASGYLPSGFSAELPSNFEYAAPNNRTLMVYNAGGNKIMVFYSLESPTAQDTEDFNAQLTDCGYNPAGTVVQRDSYGMRGGVCINAY